LKNDICDLWSSDAIKDLFTGRVTRLGAQGDRLPQQVWHQRSDVDFRDKAIDVEPMDDVVIKGCWDTVIHGQFAGP